MRREPVAMISRNVRGPTWQRRRQYHIHIMTVHFPSLSVGPWNVITHYEGAVFQIESSETLGSNSQELFSIPLHFSTPIDKKGWPLVKVRLWVLNFRSICRRWEPEKIHETFGKYLSIRPATVLLILCGCGLR